MKRAHAVAVGALLIGAVPVNATAKRSDIIGEAKIERDEWGIAHVSGKTDADAIYGMIYAQAEDDFPRIERNYLVSLGRLAEAEGESAVWQDLRQRLWIDPAALKADYAKSPAWLRRLMDAWASGLNAYLADHPEVKPKVLTHFEPWMALSFTEGSIGGDIERVPLSQLEAFYGSRKVAMSDEELGRHLREPQGSNGIAIAPARTKDGHALLLINPHTSFYFRAEQQVTSGEGLNAYGAATWGQFFIYQGFNQHAGWMHTTTGSDRVDEFAETVVQLPGQTPAYKVGDAVKPFRSRTVTLAVRQGDGTMSQHSFTTWASEHGPVVREEGGKWITYALMNRPVPALEQSFLRTKSGDLARFLKVAALQANSSNNTLFADTKGEIAYLHPQFVPIRDNSLDWRKAVDGSNPAARWQGIHPIASLPNVLNPANGWVFNVNNAPWTAAGADSPKQDAFPRYMDEVGQNAREAHARAVLGNKRDFTLESLMAAAYDPALPAFDRLLPALFAAHAAAPDARRDGPIALLKGWDRKWALSSTATSLAVGYAEALWARVSAMSDGDEESLWEQLNNRITDPQRLAALDDAVNRLVGDFGSWQVQWGTLNRYQRNDGAIGQVFDDARPSTPIAFASGNWGSLASFGAARYPGTKRMYGTSGNSFVAVVEFGPKVRARAVSIGGTSADPASPHFADQVDRYARGDLRDVWFYPEDVKAHVVSTKVLRRMR
ncbi:penicillin acylase family protein [Novosphingobium sp.]|uniref:penicillin acylase family protein n=1 Tax=Novosphingobium sp. TaxID=1874826 RepID=UPI001D1AF9FC|nr:penicillin acylase family protein [Novosphingobium sp.]MBX9663844.1 penicillin acylase family protein [Novosphingobium sp.]